MTNYAARIRYYDQNHERYRELPIHDFDFCESFLVLSIIATYEEIITYEDGDEMITRPVTFITRDSDMYTKRGVQGISGYDVFFENEKRLIAYIAKLEADIRRGESVPQNISERLPSGLQWYLRSVYKKINEQNPLIKRLNGFKLLYKRMQPEFEIVRASQEYQYYMATLPSSQTSCQD